MARTVCYVVSDNRLWNVRLNGESFGPFRQRIQAIEIAVAAARIAAKHSSDGAEVMVQDATDGWHRIEDLAGQRQAS